MPDAAPDPTVPDTPLAAKAARTSGATIWSTERLPDGSDGLVLSDGPHGIRRPQAGNSASMGRSIPATCFPPAAGLASSWNPRLADAMGAALGVEAKTLGVQVLLGPGLNIKRSPLGGRNFEYFSEDPLLSGKMAAAMVRGIQSEGVAATPKHFAVNNQETDRMRVSAEVDQKTLREIYLRAFEIVVKEARPWALMSSYNKVNGTYVNEDPELQERILRQEWGFDGLVMSDWGAVNDRVACLEAGLDLQMPPDGSDHLVAEAVEAGLLPVRVLDQVGERLTLLGQRVNREEVSEAWEEAHDELAQSIATECLVLLKNTGAVLPLDPRSPVKLAIIGELARTPRYQGGGSSHVVPTLLHSALDALRLATEQPDGSTLPFAAGYNLDGSQEGSLLDEAVTLAAASEVILLFIGLPEEHESEGIDRRDIDLPANQLELIEALADTGKPIVAVLSNGSVVEVASWQERVDALLEGWLLGQAGGAAIADVIFGRVSPSGRLAETIPLSLTDTPCYLQFPGADGSVTYGEGVYVGYRYYETLGRPVAYPFGYGLSYTTFAYSDLQITQPGAGFWRVQADVANTGGRPGAEVVQVYLGKEETSPTRPAKQLVAFDKVELEPGQRATVTFELTDQDLATWDARNARWRVEPGTYRVMVGRSCADIELTDLITTPGDGFQARLTAMSTFGEWMAAPGGPEVVAKHFGPVAKMFEKSPQWAAMLQDLPVIKASGMGWASSEQIHALVEEADQPEG